MCKRIIYAILLIVSIKYSSAKLRLEDFGEEVMELAITLHTTCVDKTGTNDAAIENIKKGKFLDDDKIKKYIACLWQEADVIDLEGTLNMERLLELCPPIIKDKVPKIIADCWQKVSGVTDLVEKIYEMERCIYITDPENFVMV